jgi:hypothetical protein
LDGHSEHPKSPRHFLHLESRQIVDNRPIQAVQSVPADECL